MAKTGIDIDYIVCDGVRVPADWTIGQLRDALAKRNIRFTNEEEIVRVFGEAVKLKAELENRVYGLQKEIAALEEVVVMLRDNAHCPYCHKPIVMDDLLETLVNNAKGKKPARKGAKG